MKTREFTMNDIWKMVLLLAALVLAFCLYQG